MVGKEVAGKTGDDVFLWYKNEVTEVTERLQLLVQVTTERLSKVNGRQTLWRGRVQKARLFGKLSVY